MKLNIEYASFFNRNIVSFVNNNVIEKCNNVIYCQSGIYSIINRVNGYRYIGKSKNVAIRLSQHKSLLRNNHHTYRNGELSLLQKAWNKYGENVFDFKIVEFCEVDKLNEREQYWIDYYQCNHSKYRQGYNTTDGGEGAYSNQNVKGRIQINNGKIQKMIYPDDFPIYEQKGFVKGLLPKTVEKVNRNRHMKSGKEHWAYGRKISEEHKRKISEANKGRINWIKGKHWDEEHKELFRKLSTGRKRSVESINKTILGKQKAIVQYGKSGEKISEYASGIEAEKVTSVNRSHISQCCNGKKKTAGGYIWRFKDE